MVPGTLPSEGTPFRVERSRSPIAGGLVSVVLRKPDRVLNLVNGKFSERFHELCRVFTTPTALSFEWGTAVEPDKVAAALDADDFKAVTLCWNETSTGLTNPIADIAKVA